MNKYASGYALTKILSFVGWIGVAVSVIGGILLAANAPREIGIFGIVIAVTGAFQGLLLVGLGSIGEAVLDGSIAQQQLLKVLSTNALLQSTSTAGDSVNAVTGIKDSVAGPLSSSAVIEQVELQSSSGRIYSGFLLESGKFRIKKGGGFLEFESKQEAIDYINKG